VDSRVKAGILPVAMGDHDVDPAGFGHARVDRLP
jgi:hypothetical protein